MTAPHVLVLGAGGQLGHALIAAASEAGLDVTGLARAALDIRDRDALLRGFDAQRPDLVINAAAYTAVDRAESDATAAFSVNRDGAAAVANACAALGLPLIHLSTDYVFDGESTTPYAEEDEVAPLSVYGASKAAGERLVLLHGRAAVVRTSWLFGESGANFVKTILRLAALRPELRVVADQHGCPTPTADLATALLALGKRMIAEMRLAGIFHYAGDGALSWHDFAAAILDAAAPRLGRRPRLVPIATADYPAAARRPRNSALACMRLSALGIRPRPWRPGLERMVANSLTLDLGAAA
jgi:dTDP-4-dehydrorhamnose reductase